jgi:hypothetical protein
MNKEYKLSGNNGNILAIGLLLGPVLATLISIIYAYINVYNPFVYLTFLVFIGYLVAVNVIQKLVTRIAKCRNTKSASMFGLVIGIFAIYASWCTFIFVLLTKESIPIQLLDLFSNPKEILETINLLSIDGYYSLFGLEVKGGFLWFIWIIESGAILFVSVTSGYSIMHEEMFCEECNRWAEEVTLDQNPGLSYEDKTKAEDALKNDINQLLSIPFANSDPYMRVNLHHCTKCQNFSTIDVDLITTEINKKEEVEEKKEDYSPVFILNNQEFINFKNKLSNPEESTATEQKEENNEDSSLENI